MAPNRHLDLPILTHYPYRMRKLSSFVALLLVVQIFPVAPSDAAIKLSVKYSVPFSNEGDAFDYALEDSSTCLSGSSCAAQNLKKAKAVIKSAATKKSYDIGCKKQDTSYLGSRIKVTTASGSTAGLSNLTSVVSGNLSYEIEYASVPYWDTETLGDYPYENEEDDPDYIEDGYEYVVYSADCIYSGSVTLVKSNAYTVFIGGMRGPEYSYAELVKMKWAVSLVDS